MIFYAFVCPFPLRINILWATQAHVYHTGDKVLLKNVRKTKFNQDAYKGPCTVTEVQNNGTVRARKGNVTDTYNLRNITPFKE